MPQQKLKKLSQLELFHKKPSLENVKKIPRHPFCLVVDNVRSLYNIGSFFRIAEAVLIEKIYLCGISGQPPNKEIDKTALGAAGIVPWAHFQSISECLKTLKEDHYQIYGLELTNQSQTYNKVKYRFPLALIVGNEVDGLSDEALEYIDQAVDIPMLGRANSLNVANAFAVSAYEILNQINSSN